MLTFRRADERQHEKHRQQEVWLTFHRADPSDPLANGFGVLEILREGRLEPQAGVQQPCQDVEIITYVREGTVAFQDSLGMSGLIRAGEFQRMTAGRHAHYSETNTSPIDCAHVFQVWMRPSASGLQPGHDQKRFTTAERRGILCVVASPDGRCGSLRLHQDAFLFSSILAAGQHVVHALAEGRGAWLHVVAGRAGVGGVALRTGDGVGIADEPTVSLTATEETEILLLEVGEVGPFTAPPIEVS